jgi:hypothetical protein
LPEARKRIKNLAGGLLVPSQVADSPCLTPHGSMKAFIRLGAQPW